MYYKEIECRRSYYISDILTLSLPGLMGGRGTTEFAGILETTRLLDRAIMWWLKRWISLRLRAIISMATFTLSICLSSLTTLRSSLGLTPLAGLLVTISPGVRVRVWVIVICRRLLLESRLGQIPVPLLRRISLSTQPMCLPTRPRLTPAIRTVKVTPLQMATAGTSWKLRKTTFTRWCRQGTPWWCRWVILRLPISMWFLAGALLCRTSPSRADPFVFERFSRKINLLLLIRKPILLRVGPVPRPHRPEMRLKLTTCPLSLTTPLKLKRIG